MKKILFTSVVVLILGYGCKDNPVGPAAPSLIGNWNWIETKGGFGGGPYTPQTQNIIYKIVFSTDSLYKAYRNDTLEISTTFTVKKQILAEVTTVDMIYYSGGRLPSDIISRLDLDTLVLSEYAADGFTKIYCRIK